MPKVWCAPYPGRFLAVMWFFENIGSPVFIGLNLLHGGASALDRSVFVIDPAADAQALASARAESERAGRRARRRFALSRAVHGAGFVLLTVAFAAGFALSDGDGYAGDVAMMIAVPGGLVLVAVTIVTDLFARRSASKLHDLYVPHAVRSGVLGRSRVALQQIARAEQLSAGDQHIFVAALWDVAVADQARSSYLNGSEFDENEFANLRRAVDRAEGALEVWARSGVPSPVLVRY
ncbi:hypothetical protein [Myceligenerans halotolerans]